MGSSLQNSKSQIANKATVRRIKPFNGKTFVHCKPYRRVARPLNRNKQYKTGNNRSKAIPVKIVYKPRLQKVPDVSSQLFNNSGELKEVTVADKAKVLFLYALVGASATVLWDLLKMT